ncbi:beta-ketoacyl-[acyl-carrier-protein] synthase family protein [Arenicella sp. 4NH20-0111]|uniref:beta-ketoacyl-[acyl-carrier-protein] synthase family protein n=1 Tax=Arenicella sp. 4NH20-0111 TaxID=3127648 RepID=UPI00310C6608
MHTQRKRIVITGVGICSAIGQDKPSFTQGLRNCQSAIASSVEFNRFFEDCYAAQITDPIDYPELSSALVSTLDRVSLWGYKVGLEALKDAGLTEPRQLKSMPAMIAVSGAATEPLMPVISDDEVPLAMLANTGNYGSAAAIITNLLELEGGYEVIATACTASTNALGLGFDTLQNNKSEQVLIVGSEPLYLPTFSGFKVLDAMADGPCSPFSAEPGMSVGEGAGALVLESYESAMGRGAEIYAEILGYATSCDAYHETSPEPRGEGASLVMARALANSGVSAKEIDYVNVHGTGTSANDRAETAAINKVFEHSPVPVSSTKPYFGHNISAAGVMEMVACLVTLPEQKIMPTLNFLSPRDYVDLNVIGNNFIDKDVNVFMKNNYAFGGNNCSVISAINVGEHPVSNYQKRQVVVTGVGQISSLGIGIEAFKQGLAESLDRSQLIQCPLKNDQAQNPLHWLTQSSDIKNQMLKSLPTDDLGNFNVRVNSVAKFNARKVLRGVDTRKLHAVSLYTMTALETALSSANLKINKHNRDEFGIVLGLSKGPQTAIDTFFSSMKPDPNNVRTSEFPKALFNSVASSCATIKGMRGYNTTLATGHNASLGAVIQGYEVVRQNIQPYMFVGGADEQALGFSLVMNAAANDIHANYQTDGDSFRPYDHQSKGYIMGEGAALMILEAKEGAQQRGATMYAQILGYGRANGNDSFNSNGPSTEQALARAISAALDESGIDLSQLDMICGTSHGSKENGQAELNGVKLGLGDMVATIPLTNFNSYFGFSESASGSLNLLGVILAMQESVIYPVKNNQRCFVDGIDLVINEPRATPVNNALIVGINQSGNCYAIIVSKPSP